MLYVIRSILLVLLMGLIAGCTSPAPTVTPIPEPTLPPPTPTTVESQADPAEVVQGFWEAMDAQDIDAAMIFIADDVQLRGRGYLNGKEAVLSFLQGRLQAGYVVEIQDLEVDGDTVSYLVDYYSKEGIAYEQDVPEIMRIQDGKIIYWEQ